MPLLHAKFFFEYFCKFKSNLGQNSLFTLLSKRSGQVMNRQEINVDIYHYKSNLMEIFNSMFSYDFVKKDGRGVNGGRGCQGFLSGITNFD